MHLKDLKGFRSLYSFTTPLKGNYQLLEKGKLLALVHMDDEEVSFIINKKKKTIIYQHPRDEWTKPFIEGSIDELIREASKL